MRANVPPKMFVPKLTVASKTTFICFPKLLYFVLQAIRSNPYIMFGTNNLHNSCFQCGRHMFNDSEV